LQPRVKDLVYIKKGKKWIKGRVNKIISNLDKTFIYPITDKGGILVNTIETFDSAEALKQDISLEISKREQKKRKLRKRRKGI